MLKLALAEPLVDADVLRRIEEEHEQAGSREVLRTRRHRRVGAREEVLARVVVKADDGGAWLIVADFARHQKTRNVDVSECVSEIVLALI